MDPLSDLLRVVRLNGAYFYAVEARAPWAVSAVPSRELIPDILPDAEHLISYHILTAGRCFGGVKGQRLVELGPGDVIVFPQGDAHIMASSDEIPPGSIIPGMPGRYPETVRLGDGASEVTTFVCGFLGIDLRPFNPLLAALPSHIHLRGHSRGWLSTFAGQVVEESRAERAGAACVLTRLAELMFIEVVRQHLASLPAEQTGWLAGLRHPVVGKALALLHERPRHPWTLVELAGEVAASRSRLAECFTAIIGQPPIQYLAQWRMQLAAGLLMQSSAKIAAIAAEVGYESEAAFSRAFKKATGNSPAAWRVARNGAASTRGRPAAG
jgi:AraC-like DNA-binding protein